MKKKLIEIYLYLCKLFRKVEKPEKILDKMNLSMFDFCKQLNSMEYRYDKLHGLLDNVADPDTFFDEKDSDRDCDDWARLWSWWLVYNGYETTEYCVTNPTNLITTFTTMHAITIGHKDNEWWLMNYYYYGPFKSEEEALNYMKNFNSYKDSILIVKSPIEIKL